jgi:hypothetical protein
LCYSAAGLSRRFSVLSIRDTLDVPCWTRRFAPSPPSPSSSWHFQGALQAFSRIHRGKNAEAFARIWAITPCCSDTTFATLESVTQMSRQWLAGHISLVKSILATAFFFWRGGESRVGSWHSVSAHLPASAKRSRRCLDGRRHGMTRGIDSQGNSHIACRIWMQQSP